MESLEELQAALESEETSLWVYIAKPCGSVFEEQCRKLLIRTCKRRIEELRNVIEERYAC